MFCSENDISVCEITQFSKTIFKTQNLKPGNRNLEYRGPLGMFDERL